MGALQHPRTLLSARGEERSTATATGFFSRERGRGRPSEIILLYLYARVVVEGVPRAIAERGDGAAWSETMLEARGRRFNFEMSRGAHAQTHARARATARIIPGERIYT